jgi:hypothetical protein
MPTQPSETVTGSQQQVFTLSIPSTLITTMQTERAKLLTRVAEINGILYVCGQYASDPFVTQIDQIDQQRDITIKASEPVRRRGRPSGSTAARQTGTTSNVQTANRPTASEVAMEGLKQLGHATLSDIEAWAKTTYPQFTYGGNHLRIGLNRAWGRRACAAVGAVGPGQNPVYYDLGTQLPADVNMAPVGTPKAATG